jgi:nucleoside-diphosphate-sugar epimerase
MTMRIFLTGATGFIGSAIVRELLTAGHQVLGLVRLDEGAAALTAMGGTPVRGSLEDLDSLRRGAEPSDGVIHTAFVHDFSKFAECCAIDQRAVAAIGDVLAGSHRPFVVTSGTPIVTGRPATESDVGERSNPISALRAPAEDRTLALAGRGVRSSLVRLPRCVHGTSEQGWKGGLLLPLLGIAREKALSAYVDDGAQRWPAVHRLDAARLYRHAVERAPAGTRLHATAEEGIPLSEIASRIGRKLGVAVASKSRDEAVAHFGVFASVVGTDQPASSTQTRDLLGWQPREVGLFADLDANL